MLSVCTFTTYNELKDSEGNIIETYDFRDMCALYDTEVYSDEEVFAIADEYAEDNSCADKYDIVFIEKDEYEKLKKMINDNYVLKAEWLK